MSARDAPTAVLVVEDDAAIAEMTRFSLENAGFSVVVAGSAEQGLEHVAKILPDVIVVDWMLPGLSGIALVGRLRAEQRTRSLPIIMVTARAQEDDRVSGLERGVDDYLTKPFSPRELVARIRAVLRRRAPEQSDEVLSIGPLTLDPGSHTVRLDQRPLDVGPTEFKLLRFLMTQPGRVFTRTQLLDRVWGDHVFLEERTIDVHIRRLRVALGDGGEDLVQTVRGVGYRLALADALKSEKSEE